MKYGKAPGLGTGLYGWAKDKGGERAHCYRLGTGTQDALCKHHFARCIEFPHNRDRMCEVCRGLALELERLLPQA